MALGFLSTWLAFLVLCLAADQYDEYGELIEWPYNTFATHSRQPPCLSVQKEGDVHPGYIFVGVRTDEATGTAPTIYDNNGELVYQGPEGTSMDFKVQRLFDQDVLTFWTGENRTLGYGYGKVHVLDSTYREIHTITLQGDFVTPDGQPQQSYIDVHEHVITPHGTMVVSAINLTQHDLTSIGGRPDHWMVTSQIYEIDILSNEILYSWDALDHQDQIPLGESARLPGESGSNPDEAWDAYHLNSIDTTNDGYLISLRFYQSAFYLNRNGTVQWRLSVSVSFSPRPTRSNSGWLQGDGGGDFYGDDVRFSWQHDVRVFYEAPDSLILSLFNNAGTSLDPGPESSGMIFGVNVRNMSTYPIQNVSDANDLVRSNTQGSFQLLGPVASLHTFAGYGNVPKVKEYDSGGNLVLSAEFGLQTQVQSYRAYKFHWAATPYWNPAVIAVNTSSTTAEVTMSWNGATEYDNWAIYSAPSANSSRASFLGSCNRTGFETTALLSHTNATHIQVVARKGDTPIRASEMHPILDSGQRDSSGSSFNPLKLLSPMLYISLLW